MELFTIVYTLFVDLVILGKYFSFVFVFIFNFLFFLSLYKEKSSKTSRKDSDIRIYMDNKPDNNEKKIDDLNFSIVDNVCVLFIVFINVDEIFFISQSKDILLERFDESIGNNSNNNKRNESYHQESSLRNNDQQSNNRIQYNRIGNDIIDDHDDRNGLKLEENHVVTMHHTEKYVNFLYNDFELIFFVCLQWY